MAMAEIPQLDSASSSSSSSGEAFDSDQKTRKISVSDSFVIDMDTFSSTINKDSNSNSRITLQRSLSRKGSQRGGDKKINGNTTLHDRDTVPAIGTPKGSCTPEKSMMVAVGSTDHPTNSQVHHQITITASNISTTTATAATEGKGIFRRNSFRRPSFWILDPKRVLLFFATLSSMGTMLLIYFTLTITKQNNDEYGGDWQQ